jgi:hypothetical protein
MFYRAISLVIVAALVQGSIAAQDQPQSPPQTVAKMQQVLHKTQEKDKAGQGYPEQEDRQAKEVQRQLQTRGPTENPFLHAWTEFGERKRLGQPEFPQQRNENRVDENCVNRMCHRDPPCAAIACRNTRSRAGGRTTI